MDQPAQNNEKTQSANSAPSVKASGENSDIAGNLKKAGLALILILLGLGALWGIVMLLGIKTEPSKQNTQNTQEQESTKGGGINLQNTVYGRVIKIDADNRTIEVQTQDVSQKIYKIKVANNIKIERPPVSNGRGRAVVVPATFESITANSIVNILVSEDLNRTGEFTAIQIMLVV